MTTFSQPFVVGLTGPLASGKSAVSVELAYLGATVLDTDRTVHTLQQAGTDVTTALARQFGPQILTAEGNVHRPTLAARIVENPALLQTLENIIYPALLNHITAWLKTVTSPVAVIEAPLLFEAKLDPLCNTLVACLCPPSLRQHRALQRPNMTLEKYQTLTRHQKTDAEFNTLCHHTINTGTDMAHTKRQLADLMTAWSKQAA